MLAPLPPPAPALSQRLASATQSVGRRIDLIVIHCAATRDGDSLERGNPGQRGHRLATDVIDGWHAERGFHRQAPIAASFNPQLEHIGYHYVIDCTGRVLTGRHPSEIGAHAAGFNANSIGVCMTGTARYTLEQWDALRALVLELCERHRVPVHYALRNGDRLHDGLCGHRDLSPDQNHDGVIQPWEWLKTCPGFDVDAWLFRSMQPAAADVFLPPEVTQA